jgi:hypothetical protein
MFNSLTIPPTVQRTVIKRWNYSTIDLALFVFITRESARTELVRKRQQCTVPVGLWGVNNYLLKYCTIAMNWYESITTNTTYINGM